jgi:hypothetical protein
VNGEGVTGAMPFGYVCLDPPLDPPMIIITSSKKPPAYVHSGLESLCPELGEAALAHVVLVQVATLQRDSRVRLVHLGRR